LVSIVLDMCTTNSILQCEIVHASVVAAYVKQVHVIFRSFKGKLKKLQWQPRG